MVIGGAGRGYRGQGVVIGARGVVIKGRGWL